MPTPDNKRPAKKSETLEVRISYPLKTAFVEHCRNRGETVSDVIRTLMEDHLKQSEPRSWFNLERTTSMTRFFSKRPRASLASGVGMLGAISLGLAAPSVANDGRTQFDALDTNRDGIVSETEFIAGALGDEDAVLSELESVDETHSLGALVVLTAHLEFIRYDANQDGELDFDEFSARFTSDNRQTFDHFDHDGDGRVTLSELEVSFGGDDNPQLGALVAASMVDDLDTNQDGQLSFSEFVAGD